MDTKPNHLQDVSSHSAQDEPPKETHLIGRTSDDEYFRRLMRSALLGEDGIKISHPDHVEDAKSHHGRDTLEDIDYREHPANMRFVSDDEDSQERDFRRREKPWGKGTTRLSRYVNIKRDINYSDNDTSEDDGREAIRLHRMQLRQRRLKTLKPLNLPSPTSSDEAPDPDEVLLSKDQLGTVGSNSALEALESTERPAQETATARTPLDNQDTWQDIKRQRYDPNAIPIKENTWTVVEPENAASSEQEAQASHHEASSGSEKVEYSRAEVSDDESTYPTLLPELANVPMALRHSPDSPWNYFTAAGPLTTAYQPGSSSISYNRPTTSPGISRSQRPDDQMNETSTLHPYAVCTDSGGNSTEQGETIESSPKYEGVQDMDNITYMPVEHFRKMGSSGRSIHGTPQVGVLPYPEWVPDWALPLYPASTSKLPDEEDSRLDKLYPQSDWTFSTSKPIGQTHENSRGAPYGVSPETSSSLYRGPYADSVRFNRLEDDVNFSSPLLQFGGSERGSGELSEDTDLYSRRLERRRNIAAREEARSQRRHERLFGRNEVWRERLWGMHGPGSVLEDPSGTADLSAFRASSDASPATTRITLKIFFGAVRLGKKGLDTVGNFVHTLLVFSRFLEPPLAEGTRRVRWQCVSG